MRRMKRIQIEIGIDIDLVVVDVGCVVVVFVVSVGVFVVGLVVWFLGNGRSGTIVGLPQRRMSWKMRMMIQKFHWIRRRRWSQTLQRIAIA